MNDIYWSSIPTAAPIDESLLWTKVGAIGTIIGAALSLLAIIISLVAFFYPRRIKIGAYFTSGVLFSQLPSSTSIYTYTITVKNKSMKSITVNNIYLNFGGKTKGNLFLGVLNQNSPLDFLNIKFPQRLEQGDAFEYHLLKDKLDEGIKNIVHQEGNAKLYIVVDEAINGFRYIPTKVKLSSFHNDS